MNDFNLLTIVLKWKGKLAIIIGLAIIISAIFSSSLFIKPKFKSWAIIYPSNLSPYSEESPTEQMLQLFQSDSIFNHIATHFQLVTHYELDSLSPSLHYQLLNTYNENVSIKKTEYEAVKIEVLDNDPKIACEIIKEIIKAFNGFTLKLNKARSLELVSVFKSQLSRKQIQIDSINIELKELGVKYGIIDYKAQSRELSKEYYRSISTGNEKKINELTNSLRNLEERGGKFHELQNQLNHSITEYAGLVAQYNILINDTKKELTYTNVVSAPYPADKKSYPVRWLIITVSTFASILFSLLIIVIVEGKNRYPNKNNNL